MTRDKGKFTSGASGNPSGKSKTQWLTNALRMKLAEDPARAKAIAEKVISMAEEGDLEATKLIWDRLEGKPVQSIEINQTLQTLDPAEVDQRIMELTNRLRLATVAPLLELTAEPDDAKSKKH